MKNLKPFRSIPGPKSFPVIGTLHKYLPVIGQYTFNRLHRNGLLKYKEFGPLVREKLMFDLNLLYVFDPDDISLVFKNDGKFPKRRSHTALQKYRLDRPHMYACGGLLPTNGEEWWRLRKESQKVLTRLNCVRSHLPQINEICSDFISYIDEKMRRKEDFGNFLKDLKKIFLEATMQTTVDYRLNDLRSAASSESNFLNEEAAKLLWASEASTKSILRTDNGIPLWKYFNTSLYKQLTKGQDIIYEIALKYVNRKAKMISDVLHEADFDVENNSRNSVKEIDSRNSLKEIENDFESEYRRIKGLTSKSDNLTMLEFFILKSDLSKKDILTLVCDSLLAGVDTTAYTCSFILYHLSKNKEKQEILAQESVQLLKRHGGQITSELLNEARYARAVLKESLRLNPISIGVGRIANHDFELRGFLIPKGTIIVTQNQVSCRLEKYFPNAHQFLPERWISEDRLRKKDAESPFLSLPFGHGPRACIGRRLAEQNLLCFIIHLISNYEIEWNSKTELDCYSHLINEPDAELKFKFTKRNAVV